MVKNQKYQIFYKKHQSFLLFAVRVTVKMKRYLNKNNQLIQQKLLFQLIIQKSTKKYRKRKKKSQESSLNEIEKIINYFSEGINQNELIRKKHKKLLIIPGIYLFQLLQLLDVLQFLLLVIQLIFLYVLQVLQQQ